MQYREVARPQYTANIADAVSSGAAQNCPFCRGRKLGRPTPGTRIQILMGFRAGCTGTVVSHEYALGPDEFCVKFDGEPQEHLQRVLLKHDQFVAEPIGDPAHWLPPLATDDLAELDEFIVRLCGALYQNGKWHWLDEEFYPLIIMTWRHRFPLRGSDLWEMCVAHGIPQKFKSRFIKSFDFGFDLLVFAQGRPPIKRRHVLPMSIPRYEPQRRS